MILLDCRHPHSPAAPDHYGPAVGTLIAQVLLFLKSPGNLARDHPMLRGACIPMPQRTLRSLVIRVFVPGYSQALCPSWPHSPGLPTSLGHQWLCSMYQCCSQVPSCPRSSPSTSIITFTCSQGNPDPSCMVHTWGSPRLPLSPAPGTSQSQGPVGPIGHHGPTLGPKWFPTG